MKKQPDHPYLLMKYIGNKSLSLAVFVAEYWGAQRHSFCKRHVGSEEMTTVSVW